MLNKQIKQLQFACTKIKSEQFSEKDIRNKYHVDCLKGKVLISRCNTDQQKLRNNLLLSFF